MTTLKLRKWDSAEHLKTEEDMALYLEACLQEAGDDAAFITKALGTVKDEASATAALPELSKISETFAGLAEKFGALPPAAKTAVAGIFSSSMNELKPMIEKILAIPGVSTILKPAIDALMEKLGAFKA